MINPNEYGAAMIKEFYEMESASEHQEAQHQSVSFKVSVDTANLLTAIAERFGQSRHSLGGEILDGVALSMFAALNDEDRQVLATKADDLTTDYMLKKGFTNESHGVGGHRVNRFGKWEMLCSLEKLEVQEGDA